VSAAADRQPCDDPGVTVPKRPAKPPALLPAPLWRRAIALALDITITHGAGLAVTSVPPLVFLALSRVVEMPRPAVTTSLLLSYALIAAVQLYYLIVAETRPSGQTLGKHLLGIEVVTHPDGRRPTIAQSALRRLAGFTAAAAVLPALVAAFDPSRRVAHDWLTKTRVVTSTTPLDLRTWWSDTRPRRRRVATTRHDGGAKETK
jgi:uncharacterized RDD family membrane protein YckC